MEKNDCIKISIAKDFSLYPGARYRTDGDNSGQQFYEDILKPKFNKVWKDTNCYQKYQRRIFNYCERS